MSEEFRQKNRRLMQVIVILTIIDILVISVAFYIQTHIKDPAYYQVTRQPSGKLTGVRMIPLASPIINRQALLNWVSEAASATYTYDQAHYKQQLQDVVSNYFTPTGGKSFTDALQQTGVLTQLVSEKLEVTAVVQNQPSILKSGTLLGRYVWKVQMPLLVTYVTASEKQQYSFIVTMLVVRVPTWQSAAGIGIDQIWVVRS
jgi:intracellular multiplication protein IcmL